MKNLGIKFIRWFDAHYYTGALLVSLIITGAYVLIETYLIGG